MTTPTGITHERFCADIRSAAVAWATARDAITEAETAQLLAAKLVYGAGDGRYRGVCHYSTWKGDAGAAEIAATGAAWKRHARVSACTGRWLRASAMCWRRSLPRSEPRPFGSSVAWSTGASRRSPETGHHAGHWRMRPSFGGMRLDCTPHGLLFEDRHRRLRWQTLRH